MKNKSLRIVLILCFLLLAIAAIVKLKGASLLRLYIESGIGSSAKIPIFCMSPEERVIESSVNEEYRKQLVPHRFVKMEISIPKGFSIVQERVKRTYFKKKKFQGAEPTIYVVHEEKDFFVNLFPDLKKRGVTSDYDFFRRLMCARLDTLQNFTDAFFVVFKSVFTPNIGDQAKVKMIEFKVGDKFGFINYNLNQPDNYFDCNVFNKTGGYFKVYIKDIGAKLDLDKALTIISTIIEPDLQQNR